MIRSVIILNALITFVNGFAFVSKNTGLTRTGTSLNAAKVIFGTIGGNTETVANYIAEAAGITSVLIDEASESDFTSNDSLIVGAPTWNTGADEQRSMTGWDEWLYDNINNLDLSGKKVAIFGVGDQMSYNDNFCDAIGELYDRFTDSGCTVYGLTSTDGYAHSESKAEVDGKFVGLACDQDNENDKSEDRAKAWVEQLKGEGFF